MLIPLLICALTFAESKTLAVQISLDRLGYSCNTIDGVWGANSANALHAYCADRNVAVPANPDRAFDLFFADETAPRFKLVTVTQADLDAIVPEAATPLEKSKLPRLGYTSIAEMLAERGHLSRRAVQRTNPGVNWTNVTAGLRLVIPDFPSLESDVAFGAKKNSLEGKSNEASLLRISLSRFEISAYNRNGKRLAVFPCSIARNKAKIPQGQLKIVSRIPNPNYTYTPDSGKGSKLILPEGPNSPVGVVWMGLNLEGFGIHGTPTPETIGRAESHGCFRLSNWNAARLFAMCRIGTEVVVEP